MFAGMICSLYFPPFFHSKYSGPQEFGQGRKVENPEVNSFSYILQKSYSIELIIIVPWSGRIEGEVSERKLESEECPLQ